MANERLRTSMTRSAATVEAVASHAEVDPKSVERWLAGRTPHARHRWSVAALLGEDEPSGRRLPYLSRERGMRHG